MSYLIICPYFRFGPYFVEPIVAGLDKKTAQPYIATMDLIGCPMETKDFVVGGTCTEQLYGMCESLWRPDMVRHSHTHAHTHTHTSPTPGAGGPLRDGVSSSTECCG